MWRRGVMENYNFEVKLNMNIKSNDLNSALNILNEKLQYVPYKVDTVKFGVKEWILIGYL